jgi:uncharacterized protein (DUF39 family)
MEKSIEEINTKIIDGSARVVTAEEMPDIVAELGEDGALKEVDVVTTGTFGAMCSSGVFFNFGHSDPPIRMEKAWLNDVEAYSGLAAVDAYLGATQESETRGIEYGGAHVLEDLISGKSVELRASSKGTDCYPRLKPGDYVQPEKCIPEIRCGYKFHRQSFAYVYGNSSPGVWKRKLFRCRVPVATYKRPET